MDRDVLYGLVFSTILLTLIGGFYLSPSKAHVGSAAVAEVQSDSGPATDAPIEPGAPRAYSPEDVRYKFEQRAKKLGKRRPANPVADEPTPTPESTENEAPPIDDGGDETAEEPPLD